MGTKVRHLFFLFLPLPLMRINHLSTDTQSWYHSQEANVMVDSAQLAREWLIALNINQNTGQYGAVDEDGFWRDKDGNVVQSSGGTGGLIEVVKGMMNAVARVRGKGGF